MTELRKMRCPEAERSQHVCDATCPYEPVETNKTLADLAREVSNKVRYDGHQSEQQWRLAQHKAILDKIRVDLEETVKRAAVRGNTRVTLTSLGGDCVASESRGDYFVNKRLKCDQCIVLKQELEGEGFDVSIGENKQFFLFDISW